MGILKTFKKLCKMCLFTKFRDEIIQKHELSILFWETTLNCNAKCKHCGSSAGCKTNGELTTSEIKSALKQIATDFDISKIMLNITGGEPLLREDLFEVMDYAANTLNYLWTMTTNGVLIDREMVNKLKQTKLRTISISIDGLKDVHDEFRGVSGFFDKTIAGIKYLKEANFLKHLQVTSIMNKNNIHQLDELHNLMNTLELDSWRIGLMEPIGRAVTNRDLILDGSEIKKVLDFICKNKNKGVPIVYPCSGFLGPDYEWEVRNHHFFCLSGVRVASILSNGDLFVCPNVPRKKELIVGNIRTDNFKNAWDNKYAIYRDRERTSCKDCQSCTFWNHCLGGSLHTWNFDTNSPNHCVYQLLNSA